MSGPEKIGRFLALLIIIGAVFFVASVLKADAAASLYLAPPSGTFIVGNTFTVSLYVNTGGQTINAVEANLNFPPDKLQVISPTTGKSFIQLWTSNPTYDNLAGTLKFQGTIPTPGISTDAGLISTVTFRVKSPGTAAVKILDSSRVLLNDGRGTDILWQTTDGIYYLTLPPPQGPIVTSRTNLDQEKWYATKTVIFEWTAPPDIQGYSYTVDQDPAGEPNDISEGINARVAYNNLADGTYYFHIKALRQGVWGGISDYVVNVDNTPPAAFKINISPATRTSNQRPIIDFATTDQTSGVEHYELKLILLDAPLALAGQNDTPFFIEAAPPYSTNLALGNYEVVVRAYDRAGNYYQTQERISVVRPLFEVIADNGLRVGGVYTIGWPYVGIVGGVLLAILVYLARLAWSWHRQVEEIMEKGVLKHPTIAPKLAELKAKQKEYDSSGKNLMVLLLLLALGLGFAFGARAASPSQISAGNQGGQAASIPLSELAAANNAPLEPPVVTMFPNSVSNDEILYIGGRASAPNAVVLIYIQQQETGAALTETATTDKTGAWFYSLPQFLDAGNYIVWTQLKVAGESSAPSPRMDLKVARTAVQLGSNRLSYEDLYFILFLIFLSAFAGTLFFVVYHGYHFKMKSRALAEALRNAGESVRRGFSVLRRDIEAELAVVRRAKLRKELSAEEKLREERLLKDLEDVNRYVGKEIWDAEEAEKKL